MGGATVEGLLQGNTFHAEDITVADPSQQALERFASSGVSLTSDNIAAAEDSDIVCVVVKPWLVEPVLKGIKDTLDYQKQMLIVIAAGVSSEKIQGWLDKGDDKRIPLFLVIPNTAIAVKSSMTFIVPVCASEAQTKVVIGIFDEVGRTIITTEHQLASGTTLASCGIAYAMRYIRAATEGGVELGFKAKEAQQIVEQTVKGAVELLQATGHHPEEEIDKVTTPGGLTIRGLNEMEHAGFTSAVIRGLKAGL